MTMIEAKDEGKDNLKMTLERISDLKEITIAAPEHRATKSDAS